MMRKEYALFGWYQYYPSGGFNDLIGKFTTTQELIDLATDKMELYYDSYQVVDVDLFVPVFSFSSVEELKEIQF